MQEPKPQQKIISAECDVWFDIETGRFAPHYGQDSGCAHLRFVALGNFEDKDEIIEHLLNTARNRIVALRPIDQPTAPPTVEQTSGAPVQKAPERPPERREGPSASRATGGATDKQVSAVQAICFGLDGDAVRQYLRDRYDHEAWLDEDKDLCIPEKDWLRTLNRSQISKIIEALQRMEA